MEGTDKSKQIAGRLNTTHKGGDASKESSDESGDLVTPGRRGFPSLTTRITVPLGNSPAGSPNFCVCGCL